MSWIRVLDVSDNNISKLPSCVGRMRGLERLLVDRNSITYIPQEIGGLKSLRELSASNNLLTSIPLTIKDCGRLRRLDISYNKIADLPSALQLPPSIDLLVIDRNPFRSLSALSSISWAIKSLDLSNMGLTEIPVGLDGLSGIQRLDMSRNSISSLGPYSQGLYVSDCLNLDYNLIKEVPRGFIVFALERRVRVDMYKNKLEYPPREYVREMSSQKARHVLKRFYVRHPRHDAAPVKWSDLYSFLMLSPSYLSVFETIVSIVCVVSMLAYTAWPVWISLFVAPFLLMRTVESTDESMKKFSDLLGVLDSRIKTKTGWCAEDRGYRSEFLLAMSSIVYSPLYFIVLGIGAFFIKTYVGLKYVFRKENWLEIPRNYKALLLVVDLLSPPELVPGMEARRNDVVDNHDTFVFGDILGGRSRFMVDNKNYLRSRFQGMIWGFTGTVVMGVVLFFTALYRLFLKGSVIYYWPLLFSNRYPPIQEDISPDDASALRTLYEKRFSLDSFVRSTYVLSVISAIGVIWMGSYFMPLEAIFGWVEMYSAIGAKAGFHLLGMFDRYPALRVAYAMGPFIICLGIVTQFYVTRVEKMIVVVDRACARDSSTPQWYEDRDIVDIFWGISRGMLWLSVLSFVFAASIAASLIDMHLYSR